MSGYPKEIKGVKPAKTNRFKVEELLRKKIDFGEVIATNTAEKVAGRNWISRFFNFFKELFRGRR